MPFIRSLLDLLLDPVTRKVFKIWILLPAYQNAIKVANFWSEKI